MFIIFQENQTTASDNITEAAGKTVENKEYCMQDTPQKKNRLKLIYSTPNKVHLTSNLNNIKTKEDETNKDSSKTGDDKHVNEESILEPNDLKDIEPTNDDSNSTFQLPSEFIANLSDDSCMTSQSPKRKTIEIKDSSLELSEQDNLVNINLVKINDKTDVSSTPKVKQKSMFRFSRLDTETLEEGVDDDMDLESFKKEYLNEVDANYKCCFKHDHGPKNQPSVNGNIRTVIDFAIEAHLHKASVDDKLGKKRKLSESSLVSSYDKDEGKKRKLSDNIFNSSSSNDDFEIKKAFKSAVKMVENTVHDVSDKNKKITSKDRKKECENRKRKHSTDRDRRKKSNKDRKLKTENRFLLDRKLERKEKRSQDQKVEIEERLVTPLKSNNESKTIKDHDGGLAEGRRHLVEKREIKEKHENKTTKTKEKNVKDTENKNKIMRDKGNSLLNKKEEKQFRSNDENKEQSDKGKSLLNRKQEKRIKDKKRDKTRSNQAGEERTQKNRLRTIDENTDLRKEKRNKNPDKYTRDRKHDRNSKKYLIDRKASDDDRNIEVTIDSSKEKPNKKTKTKLSISNREKNISVKIKWRKKLLSLKIESKKDKAIKVEKDNSKFKQYVLQYFSDVTPKKVLVKPEKEVSHLKRKYVKQDKTPDKLKQMSIQNFFKMKTPE